MAVIPIKVETYSGYRADERPTSIAIRDRVLKVLELLDRWQGENHAYFRLRAEDGYVYIIRHDLETGQWELVKMEKGEAPD